VRPGFMLKSEFIIVYSPFFKGVSQEFPINTSEKESVFELAIELACHVLSAAAAAAAAAGRVLRRRI
jgi:hypothetical protein